MVNPSSSARPCMLPQSFLMIDNVKVVVVPTHVCTLYEVESHSQHDMVQFAHDSPYLQTVLCNGSECLCCCFSVSNGDELTRQSRQEDHGENTCAEAGNMQAFHQGSCTEAAAGWSIKLLHWLLADRAQRGTCAVGCV